MFIDLTSFQNDRREFFKLTASTTNYVIKKTFEPLVVVTCKKTTRNDEHELDINKFNILVHETLSSRENSPQLSESFHMENWKFHNFFN